MHRSSSCRSFVPLLSAVVLALACHRDPRVAVAPAQEPAQDVPAPAETTPEPPPPPAAPPTADPQLRRVAEQVYTFAYPLVLMDVTRQVMTVQTPVHTFQHLRAYPSAKFRDVVSPNADTLYSSAWLDLAREPIVLSIPDMGKRYWLMPMLDGWTNVFASPGTRTTGNRAQHFAVVGPGWQGQLPEGLVELRAPTDMVWIIGRTEVKNPLDTLAVHKLQDQFKLTPLSGWGPMAVAPEPPPPTTGVDVGTPPPQQVFAMPPEQFFARLAELLPENPPADADAPMVEKMRELKLVRGEPWSAADLAPAEALALREGVEDARAELAAAARHLPGDRVNGWRIVGDTGQYGVDYERRALVAEVGLGANLPQDALYPATSVDGNGQPLTGAHRYVLHFDRGETPPVHGFWSVTLYDDQHYFVDNPLGRHALGSRSKLRRNKDGSIDLYLQQTSPGQAREANWLPAPAGPFNLVMRLYWPEEPALRGDWVPPPVSRMP
ncbi:Uncharacterized conserved protein [Nannocystis exedens]|uniref:Uncharacterized conserved protein n=1 Tax=Nannocystis exedens TaxID=54 RepID=A0A1I1Z7F4_9BACT|nr:DUF1254 domain-containing protein [Nannocystis exedens]PCC75180.1 hypothetical protein NAEX_08286 [Nannocystis exedens]SFE26260.1 Uncharacterized conserved protein [Nannocystis exedens]